MVRIAIVTRNAIHGGVETMIAMHQRFFKADVFVAGGHNFPETCPFTYTYIKEPSEEASCEKLQFLLKDYDVVIYHWPPDWAIKAIKMANRPSIEFVHRTDTSGCDKSVPSLIVTHSQFLADFIYKEYGRRAVVIPHGIEVDRFPDKPTGPYVGGLTSYYLTKGIDLFLEAWRKVQHELTDVPVRFYGSGDDLPIFQRMVRKYKLRQIEFLGPVKTPERHIAEFRLFVCPSRIEGLPIAVLEALASNVPVLSSDLPGMVEFNQTAIQRGFPPPLVLFRSEDVDDLADKLLELLCTPTGPKHPKTRPYIETYYDSERHCRELLVAIGQAIERHSSLCQSVGQQKTNFKMEAVDKWTPWEVQELKWLAYVASRIRKSRWYPWLRWLGRRLLFLLIP